MAVVKDGPERSRVAQTASGAEPLTVELPVCLVCNHVGKLPIGLFSGKGFCTGPMENRHKRTPMVHRVFKEVQSSAATGAKV